METEKVSGLPKVMSNERILEILEDMREHPITYGYAPQVKRTDYMYLKKTNGQLLVLYDVDRKTERILHINNIINVGKEEI